MMTDHVPKQAIAHFDAITSKMMEEQNKLLQANFCVIERKCVI